MVVCAEAELYCRKGATPRRTVEILFMVLA